MSEPKLSEMLVMSLSSEPDDKSDCVGVPEKLRLDLCINS